MRPPLLLISLLSNAFLPQVEAAPCCSSNAAAPALISSDDRAQVSLSASHAEVIGDVPENGLPVFRASEDSEITRAFRLDAATLLTDRFQAGATVPLIQRTVERPGTTASSSTRLGDVRLSTAYEALPEWSYSAWRPRGFTFLELTLPTGRSIYESRERAATDATGRGFHTLASGALFTKTWRNWDGYAIPEVHYSFARSFRDGASADPIHVGSAWGGSLALGAGVSPSGGNLRLGLRLQPVYSRGREVESGADTTRTSPQRSWDLSAEASYLLSPTWTLFGAYTDQTLVGPAKGTTLSRTFGLGLQHRWER